MAQGYLVQALGMAKAANNIELGAHVLAGLSDQATFLGHPDHGAQLARTGVAGLERGHSPACLARLRVLQARAEAAMGDTAAATGSIRLSEKAWESVQPDNEPEWARFIDATYLNGEYAHTFRNLARSAETAKFARVSADNAAESNRPRRAVLANAPWLGPHWLTTISNRQQPLRRKPPRWRAPYSLPDHKRPSTISELVCGHIGNPRTCERFSSKSKPEGAVESRTADWRIAVTGRVGMPTELTMADLRDRPSRTVRVTMECAGNGRALLRPGRSASRGWSRRWARRSGPVCHCGTC